MLAKERILTNHYMFYRAFKISLYDLHMFFGSVVCLSLEYDWSCKTEGLV